MRNGSFGHARYARVPGASPVFQEERQIVPLKVDVRIIRLRRFLPEGGCPEHAAEELEILERGGTKVAEIR